MTAAIEDGGLLHDASQMKLDVLFAMLFICSRTLESDNTYYNQELLV
jgi:hypothetical protein